MSDLDERLKTLDKHVKELQRRVFFCVNNYSGNHRNDENELLKENLEIIQSAYQDGQSFLQKVQQMNDLIVRAEKRCNEVDEELTKCGFVKKTDKHDEWNKENAG